MRNGWRQCDLILRTNYQRRITLVFEQSDWLSNIFQPIGMLKSVLHKIIIIFIDSFPDF